MRSVHFGLILPSYGESLAAERLSSAATAAEEAGFDSGLVTYDRAGLDERVLEFGESVAAPLRRT